MAEEITTRTRWIKELLRSLDEYVDESTRNKILGACGKTCPFTHLTDEALIEIKENSKSDNDFLDTLCRKWRMVKESGRYYVVFDQCYCPLVNEDMEGASPSLCHCTLGNIKHKMALGLDQDVDVEMLSSIIAGDSECRFYIRPCGAE